MKKKLVKRSVFLLKFVQFFVLMLLWRRLCGYMKCGKLLTML